MSDASQTTRAPTILRCTTSPQGLSVRQIVRHVVSTQPCGSPGCTIDRLVDIADACVRLGAQRQVLTAGLATQEALDRLVQIAAGRETARRLARAGGSFSCCVAATSWPRSCSTSLMATCAPAATRARAKLSPRPRAEPVTSTLLP